MAAVYPAEVGWGMEVPMRVFLALLLVGCQPKAEDCERPDTGSYTYAEEEAEYTECLEAVGAAACDAGEGPDYYGPWCDGWCGAGCYAEYDDTNDCGCNEPG
jgi:hypothetical protein